MEHAVRNDQSGLHHGHSLVLFGDGLDPAIADWVAKRMGEIDESGPALTQPVSAAGASGSVA